MKRRISTEFCYIISLIFMAFANALSTKANFGLSIIIAPAYIIYMKLNTLIPWFTFGMAEYLFQGILLLIMCLIIRRFKVSYLVSFLTAIFYGFLLDFWMLLINLLPDTLVFRHFYFFIGFYVVTFFVAVILHTYIPTEVYDYMPLQISKRYGFKVTKCIIVYNVLSFIISVVLSLTLFGIENHVGLGIGTVFTCVFNGITINFFLKIIDKRFEFYDKVKLRKYFE